jgi:hypothetical protein
VIQGSAQGGQRQQEAGIAVLRIDMPHVALEFLATSEPIHKLAGEC